MKYVTIVVAVSDLGDIHNGIVITCKRFVVVAVSDLGDIHNQTL